MNLVRMPEGAACKRPESEAGGHRQAQISIKRVSH
jgi:hypothetical protein